MYAIVDIETTGGSASVSAITEVAVVLHNGAEVEDRFSTLINPGCNIPRHITALTGISNYTVADAPSFADVAPALYKLLRNRVFVAHNVNFDYSFLVHHFREHQIQWQAKKLCTVRYARKLVPEQPSYSLGNICRSLGIMVQDRHRATGDVTATVTLFEHLLCLDKDRAVLQEMLKGRNPHSYLPMNVPVEMIGNLPYCAGVYYFRDKSGKVIYVGKAVNLKFRVRSHFTNNAAARRKQDFIRKIYSISYTACVTELMATVLESIEIKRLWPEYNRSQKGFEPQFGLYQIEDQRGRVQLVVEKKRKHLPALHTFGYQQEGYQLLRQAAMALELDEGLVVSNFNNNNCGVEDLNEKVKAVSAYIQHQLPSFAIVQSGETESGERTNAVFLLVKGKFAGMAVLPFPAQNIEQLKTEITAYPENEFIRNTLYSYAYQNPHEVVHF